MPFDLDKTVALPSEKPSPAIRAFARRRLHRQLHIAVKHNGFCLGFDGS